MKPCSKRLEKLRHVINFLNLDRFHTPTVDFSKPYIISDTELDSVFKENAEDIYSKHTQKSWKEKSRRLVNLVVGVRNEQRFL